MRIFYARHGENDCNVNKIVCGNTDAPLNETGINQAKKLADIIKTIDVDVIFSSPLIRASDTAHIISSKTNKTLIIENRFREWNFGKYEGYSVTGTYEDGKLTFYQSMREFANRMGKSGESLIQVIHRVYSALDEITQNFKEKNILIISHGWICRIIETYVFDICNEDFFKPMPKHCELKNIDFLRT